MTFIDNRNICNRKQSMMNNQDFELPTINLDIDQALPLITNLLLRLGLQVLPSFDLKVARSAQYRCSCPHHGAEPCDCQMIVLLLYGQEDAPTTLVVHGFDGKTTLSLVDNVRQRPESGLPEKIRRALLKTTFAL